MSARLTTIILFIVACTPLYGLQREDCQGPKAPAATRGCYRLMNTRPSPLKVFVPSVAMIT